jgi:hypothetical protein
MALLQGLNALRCGDRRFAAYLQMYPVKVFHSLMATEPKRKPAVKLDPCAVKSQEPPSAITSG